MDTEAVLDLLRQTAVDIITPRFRSLAEGEVFEKEHPNDLVTVADRESEEAITAALRRAYPDAMILGEEATSADPSLLDAFAAADHAFTIDPIDGTYNFVHGKADHAVMVAELRAGEVVRSWIWQPEHQLAFVAERGAGAYRNEERLPRLEPAASPAEWAGISSQKHIRGHGFGDLAPLRETWFCAGVDYSHVAAGDVDYVVFAHAKPWDHAPGALLLAEVGGTLVRGDGSPYAPGVVKPWLIGAASPAVATHVREQLGAALT
ncbi:MAG TPA: inositol monophosphatase [Actinotalea caeni]|uniref:inositol monophosphatase family protein n=1 Tax=Actinotalea caeni TaxID=1348467 RepID=UPI0012E1B611|nr:inositol monophosphatase [Actinotalea caeni]HLV54953.1 inositol monophosphatase [Actinotalea caeni]